MENPFGFLIGGGNSHQCRFSRNNKSLAKVPERPRACRSRSVPERPGASRSIPERPGAPRSVHTYIHVYTTFGTVLGPFWDRNGTLFGSRFGTPDIPKTLHFLMFLANFRNPPGSRFPSFSMFPPFRDHRFSRIAINSPSH